MTRISATARYARSRRAPAEGMRVVCGGIVARAGRGALGKIHGEVRSAQEKPSTMRGTHGGRLYSDKAGLAHSAELLRASVNTGFRTFWNPALSGRPAPRLEGKQQ